MKGRLVHPSLWLCVVAVSSFPDAHGVNEDKSLRGAQQAKTAPSFPEVYTAIVAGPDYIYPQQNDVERLVGSVDLVQIQACGLTNPDNLMEDGTEYCRIGFLVHSREELDMLAQLAWLDDTACCLELDETTTRAYQMEASKVDDNSRRQLQQPFETISGYSCYRSVRGMEDFLVDLALQSLSIPNLSVTVVDIGDSYLKSRNQGGYDIWALRITGMGVSSQPGRSTQKGILMAITGVHAREYSPPELAARWAESLVQAYGNDADVTAMLDHTEIHLILQSNPDGRFVAETNRPVFRRKNLNRDTGGPAQCGTGGYGVDLNRNFPFRYGINSGSSSNPCAETYRGTSPGSEPETDAIVQYARSIFPEDQRKQDPEGQIDEPYSEVSRGVFFDIHSFGEVFIYPWGHQNRRTGNDQGLRALTSKFAHFNQYSFSGPGNGYTFVASGATDDWAYGTLGAAGMTIELGNSFYQDCSFFENTIVPDNIPLLNYAAKTSTAPFSVGRGPDVTALSLSATTVSNLAGTTLTVFATVSDRAWSSAGVETAFQSVVEIRVFLDVHPYDRVNGAAPAYALMSSNNLGVGTQSNGEHTISTDNLSAGRHALYIQGMDNQGYFGPVTAIWFDVTDSGAPGPTCSDSTEDFLIHQINERHDCAWLANALTRFEYLCRFVEVASKCPETCDFCDVFA